MASSTCGWCGKATHMTVVYAVSGDLPHTGYLTQVCYRCDHCSRLSVAWALGWSGHSHDAGTNDKQINESSDVSWIPRIGDAVSYADVPAHIASAASEAHECFSIGARRAAILMARSVIEASAKENGITTGTLFAKIDKMAKDGIIRPLIAEAAHGIRDFGNDMAHGDFDINVTDEDVEETLNLMGVVLSEVFQVEARTKSLRAKVQSRKDAQQTAQSDSLPRLAP